MVLLVFFAMKIRGFFFRIYWAMSKVIAPKLRYSQSLYEDILRLHVHPEARWLDLGCGHEILPSWRLAEQLKLIENCKFVVGLDYDLATLKKHKSLSLRVNGDVTRLPFRNQSFDLVTANMVVEHLADPEAGFREVNRILRPKGVFLFHTPNEFGYSTLMARLVPSFLKPQLVAFLEGRKEEDVFRTYYRANSRNRIVRLAHKAGFEVVKLKMMVTDAELVMIPPLALLEILWLRILMTDAFKPWRTNIIVTLRKA